MKGSVYAGILLKIKIFYSILKGKIRRYVYNMYISNLQTLTRETTDPSLCPLLYQRFLNISYLTVLNRFYTQLIISLLLRLNMLRINVYIY